MRKFGLALFMGMGLAQPALAADAITDEQFEERVSGQAVSEVNAKIEFGYMHFDFDGGAPFLNALDHGEAKFVQGAFSVPFGSQFGLQIDAGSLDGTLVPKFTPGVDLSAQGIGAHLFWRDPQTALLGAYVHQVSYDFGGGEISSMRYGAEAELYLEQLTLRGFAGIDKADWFVFGDEQYTAWRGEVDFYATDDLMLFAGVEHSFEQTRTYVGAEAMWNAGGIAPAAFAKASFGDSQTIMAGLKVYFGSSSKSLKQRHREDDPDINLFDQWGSMASCLNGIASSAFRSFRPVSVNAQRDQVRPIFNPQAQGCSTNTVKPPPPPQDPD